MESKAKKRDKYLQKKYGISLKRYNEMLKDQNYSCAICKRHESEFSKSLHVDHNHRSKRIRAILCFTCNRRRVGQLTLEWAKLVYEYLLKYDKPA